MSATIIKCGQCRFYVANHGELRGTCHCQPPTTLPAGFTRFPEVSSSAIGCGQGQELEVGQAAAVREKASPPVRGDRARR